MPLPGRDPLPRSAEQPGFPWFVDASFPQKSPPPPALREEDMSGRRALLRMPPHSEAELDAYPESSRSDLRPGAVFVDLDVRTKTSTSRYHCGGTGDQG